MSKFNKEELEKLKESSNIRGLLKKKRDSKFASSKEKYFDFYCYGRYLAYFDGSPVM